MHEHYLIIVIILLEPCTVTTKHNDLHAILLTLDIQICYRGVPSMLIRGIAQVQSDVTKCYVSDIKLPSHREGMPCSRLNADVVEIPVKV